MGYELFGRVHAAMSGERGQGTVEYVGLILLLAVVLGGVVAAANGFSDKQGIASTIIDKLKKAIVDVGGGGGKG